MVVFRVAGRTGEVLENMMAQLISKALDTNWSPIGQKKPHKPQKVRNLFE